MTPSLSVIVPVAPGDFAWRRLAPDLRALPAGTQILFAGPEKPEDLPAEVHWLETPRGRAVQMNAAGRVATGDFLWFLHADSRLPVGTVHRLLASLEEVPGALHYFDLSFGRSAPRLMQLNAAGAWLRSHVLKLPFGDQGFCLRRDVWARLGGFPEDAPYGEDHLLVWRALREGVEVRGVGARLVTSPRKYRDEGWLKTTLRHQYLTYRQALPELAKLLGEKAKR